VPIYVSSLFVSLEGRKGEVVTRTVDIRGEKDKPLRLEPVYFDLDKKAEYRIEEVTPEKSYRVLVTSLSDEEGFFQGILRLKTSYSEKPEILIRIRGRFGN
jgi:hypothetical protein